MCQNNENVEVIMYQSNENVEVIMCQNNENVEVIMYQNNENVEVIMCQNNENVRVLQMIQLCRIHVNDFNAVVCLNKNKDGLPTLQTFAMLKGVLCLNRVPHLKQNCHARFHKLNSEWRRVD